MAYTVKIGGVDKTSLVSTRSLIIRLGADHRGSADFAIITTTSYLPRAGQAILIEDTGTVFAGLITSAPQVRVGASTSIRVNVSAQGLYAVPGRRCASDTYADIDAGDIVSDLITSYLAAEGITAGTITAGAHLDAYDTYGKTIGAVLDELASVSGYQWYIDTAKALHFVQDIVIADAAHDLDEAGAFTDYSDVQINEDLDQYRNRQIIRGGIQADGTALSYVAEDAAEIAARAAIEGGSGVYENVYTDTNIVDATNAAAVASNLLKKYGRVSLAISFTSLTTDWRPATKLKVNLPSLGISTDRYFLVERVTLQDIGGATLRVLVEGVTKNESDFSTQMRDRYIDYFAKLLAGQKQVRDYTNQVAAGKTKTYFQAAQPTGGTYIPGDTWFDTDDDNRIYEWSGSAWVAVQFGENAIADLAITNAKIADATIQAAKIGTVDAGSITTGLLNAARVAIGSQTHFEGESYSTWDVSGESAWGDIATVDSLWSDLFGDLSSNYDPTTKETPDGAQAKVDALSDLLGDMAYEDAVEAAKLGTTIIDGGYIKTSLLDVADIFAQTVTATGTITGLTLVGGSLNIGSGAFTVSTAGALTATSAEITGTIKAGSVINGSLNSTTGTHTGSTTGSHTGSVNSSSIKGTLDSTIGRHDGRVYSSYGSLAGVDFAASSGYLEFDGRVVGTGGLTSGGIMYANYTAGDYSIIAADWISCVGVTETSDERLKTGIEPAGKDLIDSIYSLPLIEYAFKNKPNKRKVGINANEVIKTMPRRFTDLVVGTQGGYFNADYTGLNTMSILAIQDLNKRLKEVEVKCANLQ